MLDDNQTTLVLPAVGRKKVPAALDSCWRARVPRGRSRQASATATGTNVFPGGRALKLPMNRPFGHRSDLVRLDALERNNQSQPDAGPAQGRSIMILSRTLVAAAMLLTVPAVPAFAHDDYDRHARDHSKHRQFHYRLGRGHERAHEEGFSSRSEHRAYHHDRRHSHRDFHEEHPGTRHDHYSWRRY